MRSIPARGLKLTLGASIPDLSRIVAMRSIPARGLKRMNEAFDHAFVAGLQ